MSVKLIRYGNSSYTNNHELLINRDKEDQHPIQAITGLVDKLEAIDKEIAKINEVIEWEEFIF